MWLVTRQISVSNTHDEIFLKDFRTKCVLSFRFLYVPEHFTLKQARLIPTWNKRTQARTMIILFIYQASLYVKSECLHINNGIKICVCSHCLKAEKTAYCDIFFVTQDQSKFWPWFERARPVFWEIMLCFKQNFKNISAKCVKGYKRKIHATLNW